MSLLALLWQSLVRLPIRMYRNCEASDGKQTVKVLPSSVCIVHLHTQSIFPRYLKFLSGQTGRVVLLPHDSRSHRHTHKQIYDWCHSISEVMFKARWGGDRTLQGIYHPVSFKGIYLESHSNWKKYLNTCLGATRFSDICTTQLNETTEIVESCFTGRKFREADIM